MLKGSIIDETVGESGLIAAERLSGILHITRAELASALGLSRDAVAKTARSQSPATQARMRDMVEILT
ncbi:MAG: XRE family transcriptional regulator, partial [Alphaproteobacteria bacterium]|nr:XRE family transcriptional regulator [Alphaproteobacteria bacterium]